MAKKRNDRGFHCFNKDKTTDDYLADPQTGLRPGETTIPSGAMLLDLSLNVNMGGINLPPVWVWMKGKWFTEFKGEGEKEKLIESSSYLKDKSANYLHSIYVISGEGTPGNYQWRFFKMPEKLLTEMHPKHPIDWPKPKTSGRTSVPGYGSSTSYSSGPKHTLPAGIRFRCQGCGHWFDEYDLTGHVNNCCPGKEGEDGDWAIECECCGSLDQTVKLKPGFPRKPKVAEPAKEPEPELAPVGV